MPGCHPCNPVVLRAPAAQAETLGSGAQLPFLGLPELQQQQEAVSRRLPEAGSKPQLSPSPHPHMLRSPWLPGTGERACGWPVWSGPAVEKAMVAAALSRALEGWWASRGPASPPGCAVRKP